MFALLRAYLVCSCNAVAMNRLYEPARSGISLLCFNKDLLWKEVVSVSFCLNIVAPYHSLIAVLNRDYNRTANLIPLLRSIVSHVVVPDRILYTYIVVFVCLIMLCVIIINRVLHTVITPHTIPIAYIAYLLLFVATYFCLSIWI